MPLISASRPAHVIDDPLRIREGKCVESLVLGVKVREVDVPLPDADYEPAEDVVLVGELDAAEAVGQ
ncbi:MAG: hypothetical protein ACOYEV_13110 [Candidatus Nanopelagicales bacterium]